MFELKKNSFRVKEFHKNDIILNFLSLNPKELEKYNLKNIISNDVIKLIEQFNKLYENLGQSEYINLISINKNFLDFAFLYDMVNMNEIYNRNLVFKFYENYKKNISKPIHNFKDIEFFIVSIFSIMNLSKKLDLDENLKNSYLENLNKLLEFETEIQEFIDNNDGKDFKKLIIAKFIYYIKESDLKILGDLKELNKENYKVFMNNFIDNFKKLDLFYDIETNNNSVFRKTVYADFKKIFYHEVGKKILEIIKEEQKSYIILKIKE